jgi:hypothetical protein
VRQLKGHGHWVNTLALSSECVMRFLQFACLLRCVCAYPLLR